MRITFVDLLLIGVAAGPVAVISFSGRTPTLWFIDVMIALVFLPAIFRGNMRLIGVEKWLVLYLVICAVTVIMTEDILGFIVMFKLRTIPFLVLLITYNSLRTQDDLRHTQFTLALCSAIIGAFMLFNAYVYSWGYVARETEGIKQIAVSIVGRSNYLASIYALLIPFCLALFFVGRPAWGAITTVISVAAIITTQSRGGVACLIAGIIVWILLIASKGQKFKTLVWLIVAMASLVGGFMVVKNYLPEAILLNFSNRYEQLWEKWQRDPESIDRIALDLAAFKTFLRHPLIGIGLGAPVTLPNGETQSAVHNLYLEILMQSGIFAFMAYMMYLWACALNLFQLLRRFKVGPQRILLTSLCTAFVIAMLNAAIEPSYWGPQFSCLFAIVVAMGFSQRRLLESQAAVAQPAPRVRPPGVTYSR